MKAINVITAAALAWGAVALVPILSMGGTISMPFPGPGGAPACTLGGSDDSNTVFLAHLDTSAADSSQYAHTATFNGSATASTAQKVFGAGSMSLPNTSGSDYIKTPSTGTTTDYGFGTGQFSFDFWIRVITNQQYAYFSDSNNAGANLDFEYITSGNIRMQLAAGAQNNFALTSTALNTWTWIFMGRDSGGTLRAFQSSGGAGSSVNTLTGAVSNANSAGTNIGIQFGQRSAGSTQLNGFMDEIRVRKVYTAPGATAPSLPYC